MNTGVRVLLTVLIIALVLDLTMIGLQEWLAYSKSHSEVNSGENVQVAASSIILDNSNAGQAEEAALGNSEAYADESETAMGEMALAEESQSLDDTDEDLYAAGLD